MPTINNEIKAQTILYRIGFIVVLFFSIYIVLDPETRSWFRQWQKGEFRTVLSTVTGDLRNDGSDLKVIKIRTQQGLFLEIYGPAEDAIRPLLERIELPDRRDGYITLRDEATNLALHDVDGDQRLEILAPTFDDNLIAHLNVFRFNESSGKFEPAQP